MDSGNNRYGLVKKIQNGAAAIQYTYDANGNITSITEGGKTNNYYYDKRNQLIRVDDQVQGKTFAYGYDLGGNMTRIREYAYTTASTLPDTPVKTITGTYDSTWKDKLLTWNGVTMTYDAVGNMTKKGSTTFTWTKGRKLSGATIPKSDGTTTEASYVYDHTGTRIRKTVDGTVTNFRMAGDLLTSQQKGTQVTYFAYDSAGTLIAMAAANQWYFYVRNAQNDIIGLIDAAGNLVVEYKYDAWGRILSTTGSKASDIGKRNPFRYRGYYYDEETGMYYLKSRYYDPELKRFISADNMATLSASLNTLHNMNIFSYCDSNPVTRTDVKGNLWMHLIAGIVGATIGAVASIGQQMITENKSLSEFDASDWIDVGCSAINTAIATTAVGRTGQIVTNVITGCISSVAADDSVPEAVMKISIGAIFAGIGGKGAGYGDAYSSYLFNKTRVNMHLDISADRMVYSSIERKIYLNGIKRSAKVTGELYIISNGTSSLALGAYDFLSNDKNTLKTPAGRIYYYVPCHPQIRQNVR